MQIEENARRLANGLAGLQKRLGNFSNPFEKIGMHLKNAQQSYQEADRRLDKTQAALDGMLEAGDVPSDLPDAQQALPLPPTSSAKLTAQNLGSSWQGPCLGLPLCPIVPRSEMRYPY